MDDWDRLENDYGGNGIRGSNPLASALRQAQDVGLEIVEVSLGEDEKFTLSEIESDSMKSKGILSPPQKGGL